MFHHYRKSFVVPSAFPKSKRASAMMPVLIVCSVVLMVLSSSLHRGVTEKGINHRHLLRHEAKNAAESICEYGFAELVRRFTKQTSFPVDELKPDNNPLGIPLTFSTFFGNTSVNLSYSEVHGGQIPGGHWEFVNPNDPANAFDPLKGRRVFARNVEVYSKARVDSHRFDAHIYAHTVQKIQVRDAPLFGHAIFYNLDFEISPGPNMDIKGPVHTNEDAYFMTKKNLRFHEGCTSAGNVFHGSKKTGTHKQKGKVLLKDAGGVFQDMYNGSGNKNDDSSWLDSRDAAWRSKAAQRWDGNFQDAAHGVNKLNPMGLDEYVPDDPFTAADELQNHAYSIIEPLLPSGHADRKSDLARKEKYAYKAGLVVRVIEDGAAPSGFSIKGYKYLRTNANDPKSAPVIDPVTGNSIELAVTLPAELIGNANATMTAVDSTSPELYSLDGNGDVDGGMFDHREDLAQHMVSLDVAKLRKFVDDTHPANGPATDLAATYWSNEYNPKTDWNGVFFVEFPTEANSGGQTDKIVKAKRFIDPIDGSPRALALQTINADKMPSPTFTSEKGLGLSTNAPLYMVGNFNADGNSGTGSATAIEVGEVPASVACDSLTVLSNSWPANRKYSNQNGPLNRQATYSEISAAILTGSKPTIPDDPVTGAPPTEISGSANNFPRLLENWKLKTLTLRGSLVALFESEVHERAMPTNFSHYYKAPLRDWGFNDNFKNGIYPPGSPNARTFRRIDFHDLNTVEYKDAVDNLWAGS